MSGRPRSVTDNDIFAAVATTVSEVGPAGLTLAAIASQVGLSAPALTQRFGSKHGLLVSFAQRASTSVDDLFARARSGRQDPLAAILAVLSALPSGITSRASMANNLAFLQLDLTDPELGPYATAQSRAIRAELSALIMEAVQGGQLVSSTEPSTLAEDLYTVYSGALLTWALDGTGELSAWIIQRLERALAPHRI